MTGEVTVFGSGNWDGETCSKRLVAPALRGATKMLPVKFVNLQIY